MSDGTDPPAAPRRFLTTRWSVVLAAGAAPMAAAEDPAAQDALAILCKMYWYPLYAYVRSRGHAPDEAQDLTQSFFLRLLEKRTIGLADPDRGRFRSFLLTALKNFLANEWDRSSAQKRGGGHAVLPLDADFDSAERRYGREPADALTPERLYDRRWALTLLDTVLAELRDHYAATGRAALFEALKPALTGDPQAPAHAQTAAGLGLTPGAVQVAVHRLRQRYRDLLREHIQQTVESPEQVEDEIRDLFCALRGS
ncbi:MAG TPA: sigma-70 family RNA polymerase sigma factor [Tepidisphaeraceae bacterium]|jgi:RNA polymerase sigma-70 factor (ECF subfamily)